jgi:hypothetical protein
MGQLFIYFINIATGKGHLLEKQMPTKLLESKSQLAKII